MIRESQKLAYASKVEFTNAQMRIRICKFDFDKYESQSELENCKLFNTNHGANLKITKQGIAMLTQILKFNSLKCESES